MTAPLKVVSVNTKQNLTTANVMTMYEIGLLNTLYSMSASSVDTRPAFFYELEGEDVQDFTRIYNRKEWDYEGRQVFHDTVKSLMEIAIRTEEAETKGRKVYVMSDLNAVVFVKGQTEPLTFEEFSRQAFEFYRLQLNYQRGDLKEDLCMLADAHKDGIGLLEFLQFSREKREEVRETLEKMDRPFVLRPKKRLLEGLFGPKL